MNTAFSHLARTPDQIGDLIRNRRKQLGLKQSELASLTGLRQPTISQVETNATGSNLRTVFTILAALDLELVAQARSKGSADDLEEIF